VELNSSKITGVEITDLAHQLAIGAEDIGGSKSGLPDRGEG
jgi:hypothetical protein